MADDQLDKEMAISFVEPPKARPPLLTEPTLKPLNPISQTPHPQATQTPNLAAVDCDDIMMPDRLSTQLAVFESLPEDEANDLLLGSCYIRLPVNSTPRYTDWHNQMSKSQLLTQQYKECTVAMPTWFMTRRRFDLVGPFIEQPAEDLMLFQVRKAPCPYFSDPVFQRSWVPIQAMCLPGSCFLSLAGTLMGGEACYCMPWLEVCGCLVCGLWFVVDDWWLVVDV